mmetsp:Transcript_11197/g.25938  ORF Transcript_11197/g.25938 Transcript_11197/m.25938 type:complete len:200 (-) Transcript_11197:490-1089(-)
MNQSAVLIKLGKVETHHCPCWEKGRQDLPRHSIHGIPKTRNEDHSVSNIKVHVDSIVVDPRNDLFRDREIYHIIRVPVGIFGVGQYPVFGSIQSIFDTVCHDRLAVVGKTSRPVNMIIRDLQTRLSFEPDKVGNTHILAEVLLEVRHSPAGVAFGQDRRFFRHQSAMAINLHRATFVHHGHGNKWERQSTSHVLRYGVV